MTSLVLKIGQHAKIIMFRFELFFVFLFKSIAEDNLDFLVTLQLVKMHVHTKSFRCNSF